MAVVHPIHTIIIPVWINNPGSKVVYHPKYLITPIAMTTHSEAIRKIIRAWKNRKPCVKVFILNEVFFYDSRIYSFSNNFACAAASRAMGMRGAEQDT